MKNILFLGLFFVVLVVLIGIIAKPSISSNKNDTNLENVEYFDESAPVMYFWQESCSYCQKQKKILQEIANETGLKVKSMDVAADPSLWQKYNLEGTPTFIAPDGEKLVGYQDDKENLIKFLEKYKK